MSLLPLCIAILYFKVEVGLCNQTNVSNNKRHKMPSGPFPPENLLNMFVNLFCPIEFFFTTQLFEADGRPESGSARGFFLIATVLTLGGNHCISKFINSLLKNCFI